MGQWKQVGSPGRIHKLRWDGEGFGQLTGKHPWTAMFEKMRSFPCCLLAAKCSFPGTLEVLMMGKTLGYRKVYSLEEMHSVGQPWWAVSIISRQDMFL